MNVRDFFYREKPWVLMLIGIAAVGIFVRSDGIARQMTHIDDIGVADAILIRSPLFAETANLHEKIHDAANPSYATLQFRLFRELDKVGKLDVFLPLFKTFSKFFIIPQGLTYAPFQFFLTAVLLGFTAGYKSVLFLGRFPSFLFSALSIFLIAYVALRIAKEKALWFAIPSALFLSFSWESIFYAKHMSNYAIGVFAATLLVSLLLSLVHKEKITVGYGLCVGFVLALLAYMQYQVLFFEVGFFGVWAWYALSREKVAFAWKGFTAATLSYAAMLAPLLVFFLIPKSAKGIVDFVGTPYAFHIPSGASFGQLVAYALAFFGGHGFSAIRFITAYAPYGTFAFAFGGIGIAVLALFGLVRFLRDKELRFVGIFFVVGWLVNIALIALGKIPLVPARHALVYLPYIVLCAAYGVHGIACFLNRFRHHAGSAFMLLVVVSVAVPFFTSYARVTEDRRDLFDEQEIEQLAARYSVGHVVTREKNLYFMKSFSGWEREYGIKNELHLINPETAPSGTYLLIEAVEYQDTWCPALFAQFPELSFRCRSGTYETLYRKSLTTGETLDISPEAKAIYNKILLMVVREKNTQ